jgi:hypothetical protein
MENVNKEDFLNWYFGGSDQEQEFTLIEIGIWVKSSLYDNGNCLITIDDLIDESNMDIFNEDTNIK